MVVGGREMLETGPEEVDGKWTALGGGVGDWLFVAGGRRSRWVREPDMIAVMAGWVFPRDGEAMWLVRLLVLVVVGEANGPGLCGMQVIVALLFFGQQRHVFYM